MRMLQNQTPKALVVFLFRSRDCRVVIVELPEPELTTIERRLTLFKEHTRRFAEQNRSLARVV